MKHVLRQLQTGHIVSSLLYIILGSALPVMIGWMDLHRGWAPVYGVSCVYAESGEEPPGDGSRLADADGGSLEECLERAALLAAGYDYDAAIALLSSSPYAASSKAAAAVSEYRAVQSTLVRADPEAITHIFFHTLIMDPSKAFDGDAREEGYCQAMITGEEFQKILQSLYERGFVLVRMHDIAYETTAASPSGPMISSRSSRISSTNTLIFPIGERALSSHSRDITGSWGTAPRLLIMTVSLTMKRSLRTLPG